MALVLFGYPGMPGTRRGTVQRQISFHTDAASRYALYYTPAQELLMSVTAIGRKIALIITINDFSSVIISAIILGTIPLP